MENEIKQLKKEYDQTTPPNFLMKNGINDLWQRVDNQNKYFNSKVFKYALLGILVLLISSGLIGAVSSQASADSALYPVKVLTQKAASAISNATLDTINKSKEIINKKSKPITVSPTPEIVLEEKQEETEENEKNKINSQNENQERERELEQEREREQNSKSEEIKNENNNVSNENDDSERNSEDDNEDNQRDVEKD